MVGADPSSMFAEAQKLAIQTSNEAELPGKLDKAEGKS